MVTASRRELPPAVPPAEACSGADAPVTGAVAGTGGWFVAAPGTPEGTPCAPAPASLTCWLRTAAGSAPWLGRNCSEVDSLCEKSTSAAMVARRLSRPTIGSRMSTTRL